MDRARPGLGLSASPSGNESGGIQADNRGNGNAIVAASGNVTVSGPGLGVYGLLAHAGDTEATGLAGFGDASVTYHSGTIDVNGGAVRGILVWVDGIGSATATTDAGTFIKVSGAGAGVYVYSGTATKASG